MKVMEQLCIKSFTIYDKCGNTCTINQGKKYTTTIPDDKPDVTVFTNFWLKVPKDHFTLSETNYYGS